MKLINGYWIDEKGNKWDSAHTTKDEAIKYSESLINCHNCDNCHYCGNCDYGYNCYCCDHCRGCYDCYDCRYCRNCRGCDGCRGCHDCCSYINNPMQYTTNRIGLRNDQTTFYYGDTGKGKSLQVICGCFRGNLEEFEAAVLDTHKDNEIYRNQYLMEIAKVRTLLGLE